MPRQMVLASFLMAVCLLGVSTPSAAQCEPDGDIGFVCGPISPEDLALVPDTPWVIVASWEDDGYLSAADSRDQGTMRLFPTDTSRARHDTAAYGSCPGMTTDRFRAHGISLRPGADGTHTLYVVRHGEREAIEVFEVDAGGETPGLTWIGCTVAPEGLGLNAVVALPDGGFAASSPRTGDLWEWHTGDGWIRVPGSEEIGPTDWRSRPTAGGSWWPATAASRSSVSRGDRPRCGRTRSRSASTSTTSTGRLTGRCWRPVTVRRPGAGWASASAGVRVRGSRRTSLASIRTSSRRGRSSPTRPREVLQLCKQ